jgi:Raf kinase inhibitor-like YbhB/YbcL family protein
MKKFLFYGLAVLFAASFYAQTAEAQPQKKVKNVTVADNYNDTVTIPTTLARIQSLKLPANFQIAKFAEVENPRMIAVSPDGTVYVTQRMPGALIMFKDVNGDGVADSQKVILEKKLLHGLAIDGNKMYLISVREVYSADIRPDGTLGEVRTIINDLPDAGQHPNRTLAVRNGKIYISVGSTCNACDESNPENATMLVADLNGQNRRIYSSGLRNTIGFGWHPVSGKMFGMDHGIDSLGDNDQEEELNEIIDGKKYGWAYVYSTGKTHPHAKVPPALGLTNEDWAKQSQNPTLLYTPHAAPMQMAFNTGSMFPAEYKNDAFVAMRGSWNRNPPSGYEVVRVRFDGSGNPKSIEPFITGFLVKGGSPEGKDAHFARLAGVAMMRDGSMLVSDDTNNTIYRVTYNQPKMPPPRENISIMLPETANATGQIAVQSVSFTNMGMIPDKHSNYYQDVSPALSWSGIPSGAKSLVVMLEDPDANVKPTVHWLAANIAPNMTGLPENLMKTEIANGVMQGANATGKVGYFGPRPPREDPPHKYHFQIFALDTMLNLPSGFNRQALLDAMKGHVIAKGETIGMYERRPDERKKEQVLPSKGH